jgi:site-specific DNA-methyltransferase (adenine-specific)
MLSAIAQDADVRIDAEFAALIPPLTEDEQRQLEANLVADGCCDPLVIWQKEGLLLDGHNRYRICREHNIGFAVRRIDLPDRDAAKVWVIRNQFGRRNLTPYQRAELALKLEPLIAAKAKNGMRAGGGSGPSGRQKSAHPTKTRDKLAADAGVSHDTIAKAKFLRDNADDRTKERLRKGEVSVHAAYRSISKQKHQEEKTRAKAAVPADLPAATDRYRVIHAEFQRADVGIGSADWIITDPPYEKKYLSLYADLSEFAARVLKPGGSLLAMVGQSYLPEILQLLSRHLRYHWTLAYHTPGGQAVQLWDRKVNTFWKPVLWFVKDRYAGDWIGDVCSSAVNDNDKRFHEWGQSESGMADIIERFTYPGQTICDPFCGGGTTGVVAVRMNRLFIGIDRDGEAVATTLRRLTEVPSA